MRAPRRLFLSIGATAVAVVLLSCSRNVNCKFEEHVSLASVVRKIKFPDVRVAQSKLLSGTEVHATPVFEHAIRPSNHCYWYIEIAPTPRARIRRFGFYLFDAKTGEWLGHSVGIIHIDHMGPASSR